jgi:hypothetical protein
MMIGMQSNYAISMRSMRRGVIFGLLLYAIIAILQRVFGLHGEYLTIAAVGAAIAIGLCVRAYDRRRAKQNSLTLD